MENASVAIFVMDERQHCTWMNPAAERLTGFTVAELRGRPLHDFIHHTRPDGTPYPLSECPIDRAFPQSMRETGEEVFIHKDGTFLEVAFTASPIHDAGRTVGTVIEVRDIREEKDRQRERERLLVAERAAREAAQAAERRVAFLAEAGVRLSGSLDVEATLRTIADLAVPALADWCFVEVLEGDRVRPAAVAHLDPAMVALGFRVLTRYPIDLGAPFGTGKVLRTGEPELHPVIPPEMPDIMARDAEHRELLRSVHFHSALSVPIKDSEGRPVAVLSLVSSSESRSYGAADLEMAQEVARRAGAALESARLYEAGQSALRRALALQEVSIALSGAISAAEVANIVVRRGLVAVGAAAGSFAVVAEDGKSFRMLAVEGYDEEVRRAYERFPMRPGRPLTDAVLANRPTYLAEGDEALRRSPELADALRETGYGAYVALPVRSGGGPIAGLSFSFTTPRRFEAEERAFLETLAAQAGHVLERAQLIEAERAARGEAEAASRAKSEFLATMSHELRTPLNAIGGYAQLIQMGLRGPVSPEQREDLERIVRSQHHLTGLINEVLSYARLESGMISFDIRPIPVADVLAGAVAFVEPQRALKQIGLEVRLPEFEGQDPVHVLADGDKLQQILINLLANAVKFTPEQGVITVTFDRADGGMAELRVADTGVGIPPGKLEAIFEPFVQVGRSLNNPGEGTGLGLAISRDLARGMGGDVVARATDGGGSTFIVRLPAVAG